jgi:hypothetical protein
MHLNHSGKEHDRSMVVAVAAVRMVQPVAHQVVEMVTVWHPRVPAVWAMHMPLLVATAAPGAAVRVGSIDFDDVLLHAITMRMI